jgi:HAD superfamily hydrolase (TIGR01549 family)
MSVRTHAHTPKSGVFHNGLIVVYKGFIFDLDGTLGDTLPICLEAFRLTFQKFTGKVFSDDEISVYFGLTEEGIVNQIVPDNALSAVEFYQKTYERLHQSLTAPFPGIKEVLSLLKEKGVRLAVVTGKGPVSAVISMKYLGLQPYFEYLETGTPAGPNKPEAVQHVLQRWGVRPDEAVYMGDTQYDMEAALSIGVHPFGAGWAPKAALSPQNPGAALMVFTTVRQFNEWIQAELINQ